MFSARTAFCLVFFIILGCSAKPTSSSNQNGASTADDDTTSEIQVAGPLRVLVLDDPEFSMVLEREWIAHSEYEVTIQNEAEASFLSRIRSEPNSLNVDVVIFPSRLLGELAEKRLLRALPPSLSSTGSAEDVSGYNLGDVWRAVARKEMRWDGRQLAVTLGAPVPLLMVRDDLVEEVPTTWTELASFVHEQGESLPEGIAPVAEPLADGWAARMFLSRAAPYLYQESRVSQFFDYAKMQPRISSEPCLRALREMVATYDRKNDELDVARAYEAFMMGRAAMAITWPRRLSMDSPPPFSVSVHKLPGTAEEYEVREQRWRALPVPDGLRRIAVLGHEGRMGAICRKGKNASLAGVFLGWVGGAEQGLRICVRSRSSAPFRQSHQVNARLWCGENLTRQTASQYGDCLQATLSRTEAYLGIRIPGQDRYVKALDQAVISALHGETTAQEALRRASEAWESITDELGRDEQMAAYRHSLGISLE